MCVALETVPCQAGLLQAEETTATTAEKEHKQKQWTKLVTQQMYEGRKRISAGEELRIATQEHILLG